MTRTISDRLCSRVLTRGVFLLGLVMVAGAVGCASTPPSAAATQKAPITSTAATTNAAIAPGATEGMWLPDHLPGRQLKAQFSFEPTPAWVEHVRLSSVRVNGASGSFVSPDGLVLTNHHVAAGGIQAISTPDADYFKNGFLARRRQDEIRLPGYELDVLVSIEHVTDRVKAAVASDLAPDEANKRRKAAIAVIEKESTDQTGLRSSVVTLYGGAVYDLYRSKRYTDVRLVFAPEHDAAFFGGDPDNFEFPRYDLDITFLRAYENNQPAKVEHYLRWSHRGVSDGELVFISGHPGRTERLLPASMLAGMRDQGIPYRIADLERIEKAVLDYAARGDEQRRQAEEDIAWIQNSLKAMRAREARLREPGFIEAKRADDERWQQAAEAQAALRSSAQAWAKVATAERERSALLQRNALLEHGDAFQSSLFWQARQLVRLAAEDQKPNAQRLPEYTIARRASLELDLFADEPVYPELETEKLSASLTFLRDRFGWDNPTVAAILAGASPAERAEQLVRGTKLGSAAERRRIREGGSAAIASSSDPMIQLAVLIDPQSRQVREVFEAKIEEPQTQALAEINRLRFVLGGADTYPDASGTLRLAFGVVKGYAQDGAAIPAWTTIGGAFEHERQHRQTWPWQLPRSWHAAEGKLDRQTPLDFVCTADITGGNSGSPTLNRAGEFVGILFDSNRQGIANSFGYTDLQARAVSVDARGIREALQKIYGADELVNELK